MPVSPDHDRCRASAAARPPWRRRARDPGYGALLATVLAALLPWSVGAQGHEAAITDLMARAEIPGLSIALVAGGEVVWDAALGSANAETGAPVTPETVFEAASLTKPVVAYAVLKLVERGELDLDAPLWEMLPYPRLAHDDRARSITARHVLSHTAGLPNWGGDPLEMTRTPGLRWGYSGEGFVYLQRVLESRSGAALGELVRREVFEPLGMTSSSLVWRAEYERTSAVPHDIIGNALSKGRPSEANAAASLHTTARDYGRFLAAVLEGRGLEGRTVVEMLTPASQVEGRGPTDNAMSLQWGLGWGLQNGDRLNSIWHWGDNGTFRCFVIAYPLQESGVVYFTNSENGLAIAEDMISRFFRDTHHSVRWLDYLRYDDPRFGARVQLRRSFLEGTEAGMTALERLRTEEPEAVTSEELGGLATYLVGQGRSEEALSVAEARVRIAPGTDADVGRAEALAAVGRHEEALAAYERVIAAVPSRRSALAARVEWLRAGLEASRDPIRLTVAELQTYVGDYGPRRIRLRDGALTYSREGATEATPLVPLTRELFALTGNHTFRVRFRLDASGVADAIIGMYANGNEDLTPRS